jgi:hypothetical protein
MTGLSDRQLTDLVVRVHAVCAQKFVSRGRPHALGLFGSVAMVVCLLRKNATQDFVGAVFGVSQPTVSRRWDLLRPVIGDVLAEVIPTPREVVGRGTVLVDRTVCPTWDWHDVAELYSAKVGFPGMNLQVAATLDGDLVRLDRLRSTAPATTPTPSPRPVWPTFSPIVRPSPIWATSASRASTPCRSNDSPAATFIPAKSSSTPL